MGIELRDREHTYVFTFEVESYGFAQVGGDFVERGPLSRNRNFHAFGDIARLFSWANNGFDGALQ